MNTLRNLSIGAASGLLLGVGAAALLKHPGGTRGQALPAIQTASRTHAARETRTGAASALADVQACRDLLKSAAVPDGRHPLLRRLDRERALRRWLELDPAGALREAERDPAAVFGKDLFRAWIELNPSAALEAMHGANRLLVGAVAKDFFIALMTRDPALAAAELKTPRWQTEGTAFLGSDFYFQVYRQWMLADPAAAIVAMKAPDAIHDVGLMSAAYAMALAWSESDFNGAWNWAFPNGGNAAARPSLAHGLLAMGLLTGSVDAMRILDALPKPSAQAAHSGFDLREMSADAMADEDPNKALAWAESRPADDPLRLLLLGKVARKLASSEPERALALLHAAGVPPEDSMEGFAVADTLRQCFAALAATDPAQAVEQIRKLPESQRSDALGGYLTREFAVDPAAATEQCREWFADPAMKDSLPQAWAKAFSWGHGAGVRDPGEVLAAIPELNEAVDDSVLSSWTKAKPEAAAGWIAQRLEQGKTVEFGNLGILADLAVSVPEFTAGWLVDLPDPALRSSAANTLTANWGAFDPEAAKQWIASLPEGELRQAAEAGLTRTTNGVSPR
jgi:hypothetical protein